MNGREWLGKQVRVFSGVDRAKEYHPMVEGEVVAYINGPSITVRASDGNQTTWPVSLPIDAWDPPKPTDGERECDVTCDAPSLWPGITCQKPQHDEDEHSAETARSVYAWSTAAVEAEKRGQCPGCRRYVCACSLLCSCGMHGGAR